VGEDGWERACVGVSGLISGTAGYIRARQMTARLATKAKVKSFGGDPSGLRPGARSRRCQNFWSVWGQRGLSLGTSQVAHMHTRRIGRCKRLGRCDSASTSTSTSTSTGTSTSTDSVPPPMGGAGGRAQIKSVAPVRPAEGEEKAVMHRRRSATTLTPRLDDGSLCLQLPTRTKINLTISQHRRGACRRNRGSRTTCAHPSVHEATGLR